MFSGIRSLLWGSSDAPPTVEGEDANEKSITSIVDESGKKSCLSNDTSALLEQTLNAATTKFTEQLLPQSQSIEQLQSSSHQLLPTLIEQHEEDELRERKQVGGSLSESEVANNNEESDDECFNADSWELLDLVDKPEVATSLNSAVQDESAASSSSNSSKQASGILKSSSNKSLANIHHQDDRSKQQVSRQKPKVSFETPDLVIDREKEKIEPFEPAEDTDNKVKSNNGKSNNRKRNKRAKAKIALTGPDAPIVYKSNIEAEKVEQEPEQSRNDVPKKIVEKQQDEVLKPTGINNNNNMKPPVLNYAAALAMKLDKDSKKPTGEDVAISKDVTNECELKRAAPAIVNLQACGAVKRNRPVSTSSWSSSDETEAVNSIWDDFPSEPKQQSETHATNKDDHVFDLDDNESILSSGFSDCDYGYHCMNDYVMRPKKSQNKRRNGPSISSSLLSSMTKRGGADRTAGAGQEQSQQANEKKSTMDSSKRPMSSNQKVSSSSKNGKPKKKKMVMSPPADSSEFLKKSSVETTTLNDGTQKPQVTESTASSSAAAPDQMMQSILLMPPPQPAMATTTGSSNSGDDIADMDESWFVTPPPCFTGSNKLNKTKAKEAARENALIEHPSIYIASTSKQVHPEPISGSKLLMASDSLSKQRAIVLKKASNKLSAAVPATRSPPGQVGSKKSANSWGNKFVVTNWNYDDQDDINDFDNMFGPENCSPRQIKRSKAKKQQQYASKNVVKPSVSDDQVASLECAIDFPMSSPALVGVTDNSSCLSLDMVVYNDGPEQSENVAPPSSEVKVVADEVLEEVVKGEEKIVHERKAPVPVKPIEPERQPGWQLRRKRRKRHPLSASLANATCGTSPTGRQTKKSGKGGFDGVGGEHQLSAEEASSGQSSARSTPTFIDRIGSSIVANLTNLASGFQPSGTLPIQARASIEEAASQSAAIRRSNSEFNLVSRRSMSKGHMNRHNDCVKLGNSLRRADRRLKMHTTPNGCSVNRKVQTNFH